MLADQFESMRRWVDYITVSTGTPGLWTNHFHFGDWLGLDVPIGSYKGSSREELIATAFYVHSAELVVKTGRLPSKDVSAYEQLHKQIVASFCADYPICET